MAERPPYPEAASGESVLKPPFVRRMLLIAKQSLQRDRVLQPMLFFRVHTGEPWMAALELPDTTDEKYRYFGYLGLVLLAEGKRVQEALFLSETWHVTLAEDPLLTTDIAPSKHPKRRESITVMGRNDTASRFTMVVQPFHRDSTQRYVFEKLAVEQYYVSPHMGMEAVSILDALFPKRTNLM